MDVFKEQKRAEEQAREAEHIKAMNDFFGEPIDVYSRDQAIEDGVLGDIGSFDGRQIVFTIGLIEKLSKFELLSFLVRGLKKIANDETDENLFVFTSGELVVWVIRDSQALTFMLPEDY
ncbi:MAG: hypothetical protein V1770_06195 [bacterium]